MKFGNDMITFEEAVAYLKDMPRFTVKKNPADNRDLKWFLKKLGNPEQNLRIIHVAGTNGKGSVCAYMSSILQEAGYRTAVFTSPHLVDMRERFTVNGKMISEETFLQVYRAVGDALQEANSVNLGALLPGGEAAPEFVLNFYEYLFCMALLCFAEEKPDYCIIETGLGGRLDATNYVDNKLLTVITRISLDHVQYLGDTTAKIAAEKAGIRVFRWCTWTGMRTPVRQFAVKRQNLVPHRYRCRKRTILSSDFGRNTLIFPCALSIIIILVLLCTPLHATRWRMQRWRFGPWKCCFAVRIRRRTAAGSVQEPGVPLWKRSVGESLAVSGRDVWKRCFPRYMWMVHIMTTASGLFWIPWNRTAAQEAGDCYLVWRRIRTAGI